jgi:hypothetical protein
MNIKKIDGNVKDLPSEFFKKLKNASKVAVLASVFSLPNIAMADKLDVDPQMADKVADISMTYGGKTFTIQKNDLVDVLNVGIEFNQNLDVLSLYMDLKELSKKQFGEDLNNNLSLAEMKKDLGQVFKKVMPQKNAPLKQMVVGGKDFNDEVEKISSQYPKNISRGTIEEIMASAPITLLLDIKKELEQEAPTINKNIPMHVGIALATLTPAQVIKAKGFIDNGGTSLTINNVPSNVHKIDTVKKLRNSI